MFEVDPIKKKYFYSNKQEQIKLNWFCYEYAFGLYSKIKNTKSLEKFRNSNTQEQLVEFCVHYAKKMKVSVYMRLSGIEQAVVFEEDYVQEFYPSLKWQQIKPILKVAMVAWDELTQVCVSCPNRCISEMNEYCHMFDMVEDEGD